MEAVMGTVGKQGILRSSGWTEGPNLLEILPLWRVGMA